MARRIWLGVCLGLSITALLGLLANVPYLGEGLATLRHQFQDQLLFLPDLKLTDWLHPPIKDARGRESYGEAQRADKVSVDRTGFLAPHTVVVAIDEETLRTAAGVRRSPESLRYCHAAVIRQLVARKARCIAIDLDFSTTSPADVHLARTISEAGNVVLGCRVRPDVISGELESSAAAVDPGELFEPPNPTLRSATPFLAYFNHPVDADGRIRRTLLTTPLLPLKSLDLVVALAHLNEGKMVACRPGKDVVQFENALGQSVVMPNEALIRYTDFPNTGRRVQIVSYQSVLEAPTTTAAILDRHGNRAEFEDYSVLIGAMTPILHDDYLTPLCTDLGVRDIAGPTPRDRGSTGPRSLLKVQHRFGVEIHAFAVNTILAAAMDREGRIFKEAPRWVDFLLCVLLGLVIGVAGSVLDLRFSLVVTLGSLAAFWAGALYAFREMWQVLDVFTPGASATIIFSASAYREYRRQREYRNQIRASFEHFAPPHVVRMLESDPSFLNRPGQRRELTVLFSDIRDFTTLSEEMRPEEVVEMLNTYFTEMVDAVIQHGGRIDKFVGDAIMAVFGDPATSSNPAQDACLAALEMVRRVERLRSTWRFTRAFRIGVGINTGEMVVGHLGGARKREYTVIGDPVNVASRLEGLTKQFGREIIISGSTRGRLPPEFPGAVEDLGATAVKGKTHEVAIHAISPRTGPPESGPDERPSLA
ncbi:MAG: adenylate/guanylate cyclase domain-containing protein [Candidatus Riflebacteria bacterium]|nr:adenylate/guanylate cyclase domain-containing protein [Candidatus Riflebacteria bacterium]